MDALLRDEWHAERIDVIASGAWTAVHAGAIEPVAEAIVERAAGRAMSLDLAGITEFDTFGACLLQRLSGGARAQGTETLPKQFRGLVAEVERVAGTLNPPRPKPAAPLAAVETIGRATAKAASDLTGLAVMLGALGDVLARTVLRPRRFRLISVVHQLDRVGLQAVPIILLITFLIGAIIAQQGIFHFRRFGAGDYVVDLVGVLVLREIGVLIVAIMVAGRSGSSYTAELGSMKMREEIDALRTMGLDPVEVLILPRVLALICALPILTFLGSMSALCGGGLVAWLYGGMNPAVFVARLRDAISVTQFEVGLLKAPFMALVIGIVSCARGLAVAGSTESLGLETTESVVMSIFLVIVLDGFFAIFFASIGM